MIRIELKALYSRTRLLGRSRQTFARPCDRRFTLGGKPDGHVSVKPMRSDSFISLPP